MAVNVTETAAREIQAIIRNEELDSDKVCLRVGVKGGGCSGFSYILDLTENQHDDDELWEFSFVLAETPAQSAEGEDAGGVATATGGEETFNLRVICDPKSCLYLNGCTVDFKDELMGRGFVFSNPNATSTCGCGSSFAV